METKASPALAVFDEFAEVAHGIVDDLRARAGELEGYVTKAMGKSGKEFSMPFAAGTNFSNFIESNPRRAAALGMMGGLMFSRAMRSRSASGDSPEWASPVKKAGKRTKARKASPPRTSRTAKSTSEMAEAV